MGGDADRRDLLRGPPAPVDRLAHCSRRGGPELIEVLLDLAGCRVDGDDLAAGHGKRHAALVEDGRFDGSRPAIDTHEVHDTLPQHGSRPLVSGAWLSESMR